MVRDTLLLLNCVSVWGSPGDGGTALPDHVQTCLRTGCAALPEAAEKMLFRSHGTRTIFSRGGRLRAVRCSPARD
jgi:hypothetical protein